MALNTPKRATKPATPAVEEATDDNVINSITVARGFTISRGDYNSVKVQATVSASGPDAYETASAKLEEVLAVEIEKAGVQFNEITGAEPGDDDSGGEGAEEVDDTEGSTEGGEEGGLTAEDVNGMKRADLEALITDNELAIDPDEHPKTAKGLASLKAAIIEAAFSEEAEDEITEDAINAMDRPTLVKFIKTNEIDVDPAKHSKLTALKAAVIDALAGGVEDATDPDADDATDPDATEGYDEEALTAMGLPDLKAIYAEWELGAFPKGPPVKQKQLAIKAILAAQSDA